VFVPVTSADDMYQASLEWAVRSDLFIASAAVADYRPAECAPQKIKKGSDDEMVIRLVKNPDIVAAVAALTANRPFTVGFAAESEQVIEHARSKRARKNLDLIIANDIVEPGIGFNSDDNAVVLVDAAGEQALPKQRKATLARALIALLAEKLN